MKKRCLFCCCSLWLSCRAAPGAPQQEPEEEKILIGFSQVEKENPWRTAQINSFRVACNTETSSLLYHTPQEYTTQWQVEDCKSLLEAGVDYLVIAPNEPAALKDVLAQARQMGVEVILMQSDPEGLEREDYTSLVYTDYQREGELWPHRCCKRLLTANHAALWKCPALRPRRWPRRARRGSGAACSNRTI